MDDRLLFTGSLGNRYYVVRIRGSALLVYLLGLAWILLFIFTWENSNYVLPALILGPLNIVTGGALVFLANTKPHSMYPRPEWPSLIYAVIGAFSTGISIPSLPVIVTLSIISFYSLVMFLSFPVKPEHSARGMVIPIQSTILGTPVSIQAQPITPDEQETV